MARPARALLLAALLCSAGAAQAVEPAKSVAVQLADAAGLRAMLDRERAAGRVVILNLWGTWCAPCLREIPELVRLQRELASNRVTLLGVAMDEPGDLASLVEPFHRKYFADFVTLLRSTPDMDGMVSVVDPAWNEVLPTTYLIGRDGKVARKIQGARTYEQFRALVLEVAAATAPNAPDWTRPAH